MNQKSKFEQQKLVLCCSKSPGSVRRSMAGDDAGDDDAAGNKKEVTSDPESRLSDVSLEIVEAYKRILELSFQVILAKMAICVLLKINSLISPPSKPLTPKRVLFMILKLVIMFLLIMMTPSNTAALLIMMCVRTLALSNKLLKEWVFPPSKPQTPWERVLFLIQKLIKLMFPSSTPPPELTFYQRVLMIIMFVKTLPTKLKEWVIPSPKPITTIQRVQLLVKKLMLMLFPSPPPPTPFLKRAFLMLLGLFTTTTVIKQFSDMLFQAYFDSVFKTQFLKAIEMFDDTLMKLFAKVSPKVAHFMKAGGFTFSGLYGFVLVFVLVLVALNMYVK
ncbi:hypothetical protein QVD17_35397 [Tagetes erecta]|uniref:Transmembrane protein n=1 Tax=Tagetes erecta TaxID=13708 RepID=A0AAD8K3E1_TARER|nr:hypothetical protein QVD17_35397 [Tagetes erecta]